MVSTHCLLLLGLLVASGFGHTSAMSGDTPEGISLKSVTVVIVELLLF